ncbi:helix-turn-helix transcriptional regulator [Microbispora sp. NPDC049125]|uniref:helix-turn-helix transcriptional regulator n=1 Tax=Microbispora sp. NPDC049125 TaxID=3154929 RepID=UPI0034658705
MGDHEELGAFLRARRARVSPQSVGLPGGSRRRVPGLRREELAQLAGISVEYYQRLEQGRATRPSDEVLDAIARALDLAEVERAHLNSLAHPSRRIAPRSAGQASATPPPQLRRMLSLMDRIPALIINDHFDVLAANPLAIRLLVDVTAPRSGVPNLARYLFLDPGAHDFYVEWDEVAIATVGQLRLTVGQYPHDPDVAALISELTARSEDFRRLWIVGNVEQRSSGAKSLRHPALGVLRLQYQHVVPVDEPRQRLVTLIPEEQSATEAAVQLLRRWAGPVTTGPDRITPLDQIAVSPSTARQA